MKYEDLLILLPCHSLEDFPTHHTGDDAAGLLAGWSALWHPALVASAGTLPSWFRADSPPQDLSNRLIIVPGLSQTQLPTGFAQRAAESAACLISGQTDRRAILDQALERLFPEAGEVDPDLAADFLALGYCYLQVQLLTRQMRYSSNLDEIHFQNQLVQAATAAMAGQSQTARERLTTCFDVLGQERDHYYPVEACILDLTLVATTTLGHSLRDQLKSDIPTNLLLPADLLEKIACSQPETFASLKLGLEEQRVALIGGEYSQARLPLLSCETIRSQLLQGLSCYETLLGCRPRVYGRWRCGLTPLLPQILHKCGFTAALHATLDDGVFPEGTQIKIRWEGCDGTALDAIARPPLDASKPGSYLNYGIKMGESMDMDHVATICLAHWPGQISPWYEDLRRISRYGSALGKFVTIEAYFRDTDVPAHQDRFRADQYRAPYLKQAVAAQQQDPISSCVRYWHRRELLEAVRTLQTLTGLVAGRPAEPDTLADSAVGLLEAVDAAADEAPAEAFSDEALQALHQQAAARFADCLPRTAKAAERGYLVVNPHSFVRRIGVEMPQLEGLPEVERPIYAAAASGKTKYVVVDVPPLGFAWVSGGGVSAPGSKSSPAMTDECLLRNEFFEVLIDPATGGLRAIREYNSRNNRMSQQLALRRGSPARRKSGEVWQETELSGLYSVMAADSVETTLSTPVVGEIVARGRLVDRDGKELAGFRQTYRLWRGSRVLQLEIELDPRTECQADVWNSYYAARFAWADEGAELRRGVNLTRQPTSAKRFEAPLYVEVDNGGSRTTILTGGLPFHRLAGLRMLDSLLVARGESCRKFRLGIGVELKNPLHEALGLQAPTSVIEQSAPPPSPSRSGWLFHVDARNILATHWEPLLEGAEIHGFRVRLLETLGRAAKVTLSGFRAIARARQRGLDGAPLGDCTLAEGRVQLQMAAHEWSEIEAYW